MHRCNIPHRENPTKENTTGEILAMLKSKAEIPLTSMGPRFLPRIIKLYTSQFKLDSPKTVQGALGSDLQKYLGA